MAKAKAKTKKAEPDKGTEIYDSYQIYECGHIFDRAQLKTYSKDNLPSDPRDWPEYRKKHLTKMVRIDGAFAVETREGLMTCPDGFLALGSDGYPHPIAVDEQEKTYEPV